MTNSNPVTADHAAVIAGPWQQGLIDERMGSPLLEPLVFITGVLGSGTATLARLVGAHSRVTLQSQVGLLAQGQTTEALLAPVSDELLLEMAGEMLRHMAQPRGPNTVSGRGDARGIVASLSSPERTRAGLYAVTLKRMAPGLGGSIVGEWAFDFGPIAEQLLQVYPNCRIVASIRDPRAVLASHRNRAHAFEVHGGPHGRPSDAREAAHLYHPISACRDWVAAMEPLLRLARHERVRLVRFEDLAADPDGQARQLCEFLGLAYETGMTEDVRDPPSHQEPGAPQPTLLSDPIDRWRWELPDCDAYLCERLSDHIMQRLGYAPEKLFTRGGLTALPCLLSYPLHLFERWRRRAVRS